METIKWAQFSLFMPKHKFPNQPVELKKRGEIKLQTYNNIS